MKIAMLQIPLVWENKEENIKTIETWLDGLEDMVDLVVLPEMFTSGFTMRPEHAFSLMEGQEVAWLKKMAVKHAVAITGSLVIREHDHYYNRLLFVYPDGCIHAYDKRHLFSLAGEEKVYAAGVNRLIVSYRGWNICPLVCYDLRFPAYARNLNEVYDLLLYVASWPDQRIYAWDTLLKARAVENMAYVVGVNRTGEDENNNVYSGHSQAIDCLGRYVQEPLKGGPQISYVVLDKEKQDKARAHFGFLKDADSFVV